MTIYYSATTNAFYDSQVYNVNNIPEDKVAVAESTYKNLMAQQCAGRVIVAAADGTPTTIAQTCGSCTSTKYATKTELNNGLATKADKTHTHSDLATKTELNNGLATKADKTHTHSDLATKTELTNGLAGKADKSHTHSDKANDNAVVHTSGAETINGAKTFTSNPIVENTNPLFLIKNSNVNKGTAPTSNIYSGLWLNDKNGIASKNRIAGLGAEINTAGRYRSYLCAYKPVAGASDYSQISISYAADGTVTTSAPTPPADDNSTQIATTAWVTAKDNNVVHKTGNETVAGVKTFTRYDSYAAIALTPGSFKKGDASDVRVACLYTGDGTSYANSLNVYDVGTSDSGNITSTAIISIENTAGVSGASKRTSLQVVYHKNPTDGRKQYATLSGDFLPLVANTYNLGSESNPWATLQATTGVFKDDVLVGGDQLMITSDETEVFTGRRISWAKNADTLPTKAYNLNFGLGGNNSSSWANRIGGFRVALDTIGDVETAMYAHDTTGASKGQGMIGIYYRRATDSYETIAPTPPANDNSTQIATTEWVNSAKATIPQNYLGRQPKTFKTLWAGHFASDSVTLSEPFTNYKWLLIKLSNDSDWGMHYHYISTYDLNKMLNGETHGGYVNKSVTLGGSYLYWNIHTYANGSTTTYFSYENDNCRLREIIGINEFY